MPSNTRSTWQRRGHANLSVNASVGQADAILKQLDDDPVAGLRATAALMRNRAADATGDRWHARGGGFHPWVALYADEAEVAREDSLPSMEAGGTASHADSEHIASWDPASTTLVADWLDVAGADIWAHGPVCVCGTGCDACDDNLWEPHARAAIALARTYLGGVQ